MIFCILLLIVKIAIAYTYQYGSGVYNATGIQTYGSQLFKPFSSAFHKANNYAAPFSSKTDVDHGYVPMLQHLSPHGLLHQYYKTPRPVSGEYELNHLSSDVDQYFNSRTDVQSMPQQGYQTQTNPKEHHFLPRPPQSGIYPLRQMDTPHYEQRPFIPSHSHSNGPVVDHMSNPGLRQGVSYLNMKPELSNFGIKPQDNDFGFKLEKPGITILATNVFINNGNPSRPEPNVRLPQPNSGYKQNIAHTGFIVWNHIPVDIPSHEIVSIENKIDLGDEVRPQQYLDGLTYPSKPMTHFPLPFYILDKLVDNRKPNAVSGDKSLLQQLFFNSKINNYKLLNLKERDPPFHPLLSPMTTSYKQIIKQQ